MTERTTTAAEISMDADSGPSRADSRRASRAAFVGTLLEYYDFSLYASAASVVFASVFFTGSSPYWGRCRRSALSRSDSWSVRWAG